jgi:hypothetical protein
MAGRGFLVNSNDDVLVALSRSGIVSCEKCLSSKLGVEILQKWDISESDMLQWRQSGARIIVVKCVCCNTKDSMDSKKSHSALDKRYKRVL